MPDPSIRHQRTALIGGWKPHENGSQYYIGMWYSGVA